MAHFKINTVPIKDPSTFRIERYNITTLNRLAAAKMVGDLVAKKRKFHFGYDCITATELNHILDLIWNTNSLFYRLDYEEDNVWKNAIVYSGDIPSELHSARSSEWVWKNVNFDLIEQ